jgi:hypothetical protein
MKLAKNTSCLSLIDHAFAFPPPTPITGTIFPASSIVIAVVVVVIVRGRDRLRGCGTAHAGRQLSPQIVSAVGEI